jgi:heat shock protein HspQ
LSDEEIANTDRPEDISPLYHIRATATANKNKNYHSENCEIAADFPDRATAEVFFVALKDSNKNLQYISLLELYPDHSKTIINFFKEL